MNSLLMQAPIESAENGAENDTAVNGTDTMETDAALRYLAHSLMPSISLNMFTAYASIWKPIAVYIMHTHVTWLHLF